MPSLPVQHFITFKMYLNAQKKLDFFPEKCMHLLPGKKTQASFFIAFTLVGITPIPFLPFIPAGYSYEYSRTSGNYETGSFNIPGPDAGSPYALQTIYGTRYVPAKSAAPSCQYGGPAPDSVLLPAICECIGSTTCDRYHVNVTYGHTYTRA